MGLETHERLSGDPEWNKQIFLHLKEITGYLAHWAVRNLRKEPCPPKLEAVVEYLDMKLRDEFKKRKDYVDDGFASFSLCEISKMLHDILIGQSLFDAWNTEECLKDDWLDIHALLHNVCISIRDDRRQDEAWEAERDERLSQKTLHDSKK